MPHERLEDVLHEAFTELTLHGDIYLADFAESLSPGLGRGPVKLLFKLKRLGPLRVKDLAAQLRLDPTTVTRHVDDLARRDLVARTPDPHDGRAVLIGLSRHAYALLDVAETERRGKLRDSLADWTAAERATFVRLLSKFVQRDDLASHVAALAVPQRDPRPLDHEIHPTPRDQDRTDA